MAPYLVIIAILCIVIIIMLFDNIKEKFIKALGLDDRYVKKENCQSHRQDFQFYIDSGRQQILDKLDIINETLSQMKVAYDLYMGEVEHKLNEDNK